MSPRDQHHTPTFSPDQLSQMFATCDLTAPQGQRDATIMLVLIQTGVRVSELCRLRLQDIHETSLHVAGKGSIERDIEIGQGVHEQLQFYIHHVREPARPDEPRVFMNSEDQPLRPRDVSQIIHEIKKRSGITDAGHSIHTFRNTFQLLRTSRGTTNK